MGILIKLAYRWVPSPRIRASKKLFTAPRFSAEPLFARSCSRSECSSCLDRLHAYPTPHAHSATLTHRHAVGITYDSAMGATCKCSQKRERVVCLLKVIAEGTYNSKHAEAAKLYYTTILLCYYTTTLCS